MRFEEEEAEFSIDEIDSDLVGGNKHRANPLKEFTPTVIDENEGDYDSFESHRSRLVTHYAVKKHIVQKGKLVWKTPPQAILDNYPEARFGPNPKFPHPPPYMP